MRKKLRIYRGLLLGLVFLSAVMSFVYIRHVRIDDYSVEITSPKEYSVVPLSKNKVINVNGLEGKVVVQIQNRTVRVVSSRCENQICVKTGEIKSPGPMIICAPNQVMVRIIKKRMKTFITY